MQQFPTPCKRFFRRWIVVYACCIVFFAAGSCKTCKCPAYSYDEARQEIPVERG
jgi:hypothetical protein